MASNITASGADEPDDEKDESASKAIEKSQDKLTTPSGRKNSADGFFTIYKYGQGKWTRLGTLMVGGFLAVLTTFNVYQYLVSYWPGQGKDTLHDRTLHQYMLCACIVFLAVLCGLIFRVSNRQGNVDFLIATDSEMKKVNWTTKGELLGSTRVVVLFLFFIAIFLFVVDLLFSAFFQLIGVLLKAT